MIELTGRNNTEKIWNRLLAEGYTPAGVAGVMANLNHESGLKANNLEDRFQSTLGSDTYYTSAVNGGTYTKDQFINDRAGYGIAQWTYYTRKKKLYEATVELGLSIADLGGQLRYLISEIKGYKSLDSMLRTSKDVNACCDKFLKDFESPAILDYDSRRKFAWQYYNLFANGLPKEPIESGVNPDTSEYKTYTVKAGDSWWSIACKELKSGTRMNELAKLNNRSTKDIIHPGMVLMLPEKKDEVIKVENSKDPVIKPDTSTYSIYEVMLGDTWWKIAATKMHDGTKMHELAKYNGRNTMSTLYAGEKIKIPVIKSESDIKSEKTYKVKSGDSWWSIALKEMGSGTKMVKLAEYNGKNIKDTIYPGNILKIPAK